MNEESNELPPGWAESLFSEVIENLDGRRVPVKRADRANMQGEFPYYGASGIIDQVNDYLFEGPHLLIAEDGANLLSRTTPIAFKADGKFWVNNHAHVVRPLGGIPIPLMEAFFGQLDLRPHITGTAQPKLTQRALNELSVALPPLAEQKRIVAKLEALQERSDAAKQALDAIPPLLEQFRQSVLAAAFRGDLTKAWRAENPDVEPASELLARIRVERRTRWIENAAVKARDRARARAAKAGKPWSDEHDAKVLERERAKAAKKYKEPEPVDAEGLPELPEGWCWVRFDELIVDSLYGPRFPKDAYSAQGTPTLRTTDIQAYGRIRYRDPPRISEELARLDEWGLEHEDIVVTRSGTIGKCAIHDASSGPALPSAYLIRLRLARRVLNAHSILWWLLSPSGQQSLSGGARAVAQPNVNAQKIRAFVLPLPPAAEQAALNIRIEERLRLIDEVAKSVEASEARWAVVSQSILAKAFRGELVPQDPTDEPASALLERIRAEREAAEATKGKKKRGRGRGRRKKPAPAVVDQPPLPGMDGKA